jgi:serine protease Do
MPLQVLRFQRYPIRRRPGFGQFASSAARRAFVAVLLVVALGAPVGAQPQDNSPSTNPRAVSEIADLPALKELERKALDVIPKVMPAVVAVSGGSGVVVSQEGLVLTVAHVGRRAGRRVLMTFPDGRSVQGVTLGNDEAVDAGMIKITDQGTWPHVQLGRSADVQTGQWCLAMGYPVMFERAKPPVVRIGRVLRSGATTIVTDCTIMGGDSGGPLFDLDGKLIGIGSRCDNRLTVNIHVPVDCYHDNWDRLTSSEDFDSRQIEVAFLGIVPDEDAAAAKVVQVFEDSGAAQAGIQVGDVVVRFEDAEIARSADLPPLIRKRKPGDKVQLELLRGDQRVRLEVVLGKQ